MGRLRLLDQVIKRFVGKNLDVRAQGCAALGEQRGRQTRKLLGSGYLAVAVALAVSLSGCGNKNVDFDKDAQQRAKNLSDEQVQKLRAAKEVPEARKKYREFMQKGAAESLAELQKQKAELERKIARIIREKGSGICAVCRKKYNLSGDSGKAPAKNRKPQNKKNVKPVKKKAPKKAAPKAATKEEEEEESPTEQQAQQGQNPQGFQPGVFTGEGAPGGAPAQFGGNQMGAAPGQFAQPTVGGQFPQQQYQQTPVPNMPQYPPPMQ
ncbi:MAG: hypothetical protein LBF72_00145 [Holosporales bacterium]|jgi:hypothetical protein|nr:hypothetical protein [Holosporales bacterium]